jgi:hypothetical protein
VALVVEVALTTAGYKRHKRGEWRKTRSRLGPFKPPVPLPRPSRPKPAPAPNSLPGPVSTVEESQGPPAPSDADTALAASGAPAEETLAPPGPLSPAQRSESQDDGPPTEDTAPARFEVPPTPKGCQQRPARALSEPAESPGPVAPANTATAAEQALQNESSTGDAATECRKAPSAQAGQDRKCHIINVSECHRVSGCDPDNAQGPSSCDNTPARYLGQQWQPSHETPFFGRECFRRSDSAGPPPLSGWSSALPPPVTMRPSIDP